MIRRLIAHLRRRAAEWRVVAARLREQRETVASSPARCEHERAYFYRRAIFHESQHFNADRAGREAREDLDRARPVCGC